MMRKSDTSRVVPPITSGNSCRSGCAPAVPYPATDTKIINKFIIGDTHRLH
ncbi:MAG: hypothetical protein FWC30_04765 [Candidatus Bathyarchaeota archaeon]|nr:hypothetical protein [Candidatus Termiticorpusculum sp.]